MIRLARHFAQTAFLLALSVSTAFAEDWSSLLLDRTVTLAVPDSFVADPAFSDASSNAAIVEFLPPGQTVEAWSEMLTLTAYKFAADGLDPYGLVMVFAEELAMGYGSACPDGFSNEELGSPALTGAQAVVVEWMACDQLFSSGESEAMVVLIFSVGSTIYTAQWAERGTPTAGPPVFDFNHWLPRLDALMTIRL